MVYVGQTWQSVKIRAGSGGIKYMQCPRFWTAIQKDGWNNFETEELCSCWNQQDANRLEDHFRDMYDSCNPEKGYNISTKGSTGRRSAEVRAKIGASKKGKPLTTEHRMKISASNKGKKMSSEAISKMSATKKGKIFTDKHKQNLSTSHMGNKPTDETKAKMSAVHMGIEFTEEHKQKLRGENNASVKLTAEQVLAIRADERTQVEIAEAYGISQTQISRIITRQSWKHI